MTFLISLIVFILGAVIGSFISVIIYRIKHNKKGIIFSRSYCPHCQKKLKYHHLIPIFSFAFLRGKCAYCGEKISSHYLFLELFTAIVFVLTFLNWNFLVAIPSVVDPRLIDYSIDWKIFEFFTFYLIEISILIGIFFYDLMYKEIPDRLSLTGIGVAIAAGLVLGTPSALDMLLGGIAICAFFFLQFLISKGKWIGGGDLRLGALMGVLLGLKMGILALILSYLIGTLFTLPLLITKKLNRKSAIPFGPFLVTATLITLFIGEEILNWYFYTLLT